METKIIIEAQMTEEQLEVFIFEIKRVGEIIGLPKSEAIKQNKENYKKLDMHHLFYQFGWKIKTGEKQKRGSCADIYAEQKDDISEYFMLIDDGYCEDELNNALYHIYANNFKGKIFEGRIGNEDDFTTVMRVLGFKKEK